MGDEGQDGENNTQRSKAGVLASVRTSVGAMNFKGEPGQREKTWKLWRERFERATRWMAVSEEDKLDLFLLVGGEELQKLVALFGCFHATICRDQKSIQETVYVVNRRGNTALLSRQVAGNMGLVEYHIEQTTKAPHSILGEERQAMRDMVQEYEDVFTGIGKLKGVTVKLHVDPNASGAVQKQSVPTPEKQVRAEP
ncbi:hypothetical protein OS493_007164 [Desmophyllum pertusum]|uniref:Uncharacterized protein n=1 Tax=Desmophyllum pertusum TaxID=174260 RepID=A0A9W9ZIU2_9CNID|nr:hypothetical protein OS493_007164 [Desmophyllum pertusum]